LGGSTVMGRGMAWHDGHGMAAPAPKRQASSLSLGSALCRD
jgi:hypothetical protein